MSSPDAYQNVVKKAIEGSTLPERDTCARHEKSCYPLVTVGIPTYNRCQYLREALDSVSLQSYDNIEIVISDNASTDDTAKYLNSVESRFHIKVIQQQSNLGMVRNWNACLDAATGEYFLLLSDDDVLYPNAIKILVDRALEQRDLSFVYGLTTILGDKSENMTDIDDRPPPIETAESWLKGLFNNSRDVLPSATLFSVDVARKYGGYPSLGTVTDFALLVLLAAEDRICYENRSIAKYRKHDSNMSDRMDVIYSIRDMYMWLDNVDSLPIWYISRLKAYLRRAILIWAYSQCAKGEVEKVQCCVRVSTELDFSLAFQCALHLVNLPGMIGILSFVKILSSWRFLK